MGLDEKRARACWAEILGQLGTTVVSEDGDTYSAAITAGGKTTGQLHIMRTREAVPGCKIVLKKGFECWDLSQIGEHDAGLAARAVTHLILDERSGKGSRDKRKPKPAIDLPGDDPWGDPWRQEPVRIVDITSLAPLKRM